MRVELQSFLTKDKEIEKVNDVKKIFVQAFKNHAYRTRLSQKDYCRNYGFSQARISEIFRYKYEKISIDRLCLYLAKVSPNFLFTITLNAYHTDDEQDYWQKNQRGFKGPLEKTRDSP